MVSKEAKSEGMGVVLAIVLSVVFGVVTIFLGEFAIEEAQLLPKDGWQTVVERAGMLIALAGVLAILVVILELVLWPWLSMHRIWSRWKDDPRVVAAFVWGFFFVMGMFVHGALFRG